MTINWDINAATIVPIIVGFLGTIWRLHNWDVKTEIRHSENTSRFVAIEGSHKDIQRDLATLSKTQEECQKKITDTRETVIRLEALSKRD